jgi:hypothetical protein
VPFRKSNLDTSDLATSLLEVNRKISEKLKVRGELVCKGLELASEDIKVEEPEKKLTLPTKANEDNFKIEYSLNLKDDEEGKLNKGKNKKVKPAKSATKPVTNDDEEEFYSFTQSKKKACADTTDLNDAKVAKSASKFTLLESPVKNDGKGQDSVAKDVNNKIIKRKWKQVIGSKGQGQEFVSNDKVILKLNTMTSSEKFKEQSGEESIQRLNEAHFTVTEKKEAKKEIPQEDEEMDSDSDLEIPDIF